VGGGGGVAAAVVVVVVAATQSTPSHIIFKLRFPCPESENISTVISVLLFGIRLQLFALCRPSVSFFVHRYSGIHRLSYKFDP
jgi:hypothetical protein